MKTLGHRLGAAMSDLRLTQDELAKRAGVSQTSVGRWLSGNAMPHPKILPDLARALNCSEEWLKTGNQPPSPKVAAPTVEPVNIQINNPASHLTISELWDMVEGLPDLIAAGSNSTVRQCLADEAKNAARQLKKRIQS